MSSGPRNSWRALGLRVGKHESRGGAPAADRSGAAGARARRAAGLALGCGAGFAALLLPALALALPWPVLALQEVAGMAQPGLPDDVLDAATREIVGDLYDGGDFRLDAVAAEGLALADDERAHMRDVRRVLRAAWAVAALAAAVALTGAVALRGDRRALGAALRRAGIGAAIAAAVLVLAAALAFGPFFEAFHALLFPQGGWRFPSDSALIRLFPEPFWRLAALLALAMSLVLAAACVLCGHRLARAPRRR